MRHTTRRRVVPIVLALVATLAAVGCSGSDDPDAADDEALTAMAADFCIMFPARDANVMLEAVKDPQLEGNDEIADSFLEMGAKGLVEKAPPSLQGAVETYAAGMRNWQPGQDLTSDPDMRAAVTDINAWLAANCGPPTGSVPVRTAPPGTAG